MPRRASRGDASQRYDARRGAPKLVPTDAHAGIMPFAELVF